MAKTKKTFRLDDETIRELERLASDNGVTMTDALESAIHGAIRQAIREPDDNEGDYSAMLDTLRDELAIKNRQIDALNDTCRNLSQSLIAAQALHGADLTSKSLHEPEPTSEPTDPAHERKGLLTRLKSALFAS